MALKKNTVRSCAAPHRLRDMAAPRAAGAGKTDWVAKLKRIERADRLDIWDTDELRRWKWDAMHLGATAESFVYHPNYHLPPAPFVLLAPEESKRAKSAFDQHVQNQSDGRPSSVAAADPKSADARALLDAADLSDQAPIRDLRHLCAHFGAPCGGWNRQQLLDFAR